MKNIHDNSTALFLLNGQIFRVPYNSYYTFLLIRKKPLARPKIVIFNFVVINSGGRPAPGTALQAPKTPQNPLTKFKSPQKTYDQYTHTMQLPAGGSEQPKHMALVTNAELHGFRVWAHHVPSVSITSRDLMSSNMCSVGFLKKGILLNLTGLSSADQISNHP